jgi:hypothetical protein
MKITSTPYVSAVDRFDGSLIIYFSDGRGGIFPAHLLFSRLNSSQVVTRLTTGEPIVSDKSHLA